jgi:membrane-associated protein
MTLALGPSWLDPNYLLDTYGIWGLLLVVFAESGLLIGFFLPGDSLLFTCGLLITSDQLDVPLWAAIALICLAAVLGDQAGFMFGRKVGPSLFNRPDSRLFKQENIVKAHEFFEKYGPKSLILARFVPVVRTFTPIIAGVSGMRYRSFVVFNVIGGVLWGSGVTLLGSWLGNIGVVRDNIEAMLILVVLVSVVPIAIEFLRARAKARKETGSPAAHQEQPQGQQPYQEYQEHPRQPYQQPYSPGQQPYGQQPAMDDATTRLRPIEPPYRQYGERNSPQYPPQAQEQPHHGDGYGGQQYVQQPYPQQPYPQQTYATPAGENDQNADPRYPNGGGYYRAP